MRRRALVAAVAGWVTVVGAASAVAWVAIDRAGREVLTSPASGLVDVRGAATTTPRPLPTTTPTGRSGPGASSSSSRPSSAVTRTRTATRTAAPTAASSPLAVDRSVRVDGGQVGVRCVARTISLRFAQPADGWSVEVGDRGPSEVKVRFTSSDRQRELEVEARCSGGTPVFSTSSDDHGSDGGDSGGAGDSRDGSQSTD